MILSYPYQGINVNIDDDHTVLIGRGNGESYYFVLCEQNDCVYCCTEQEGVLHVTHHVADACDCGIQFPCYG